MFDTINLPNEPGCYLFKDKNENIIYIGKAKNIKKRIKQYSQINDFDITHPWAEFRGFPMNKFGFLDNDLSHTTLLSPLWLPTRYFTTRVFA